MFRSQDRAAVAHIARKVDALTAAVDHLHRAVHKLEETIVTTKDEISAKLGDVKTTLVETKKDVGRVAADLKTALDNNDLTAIGDAVDELQGIASGIDADAEGASPEPVPPFDPNA
jgi:prophage DNA circulation protein